VAADDLHILLTRQAAVPFRQERGGGGALSLSEGVGGMGLVRMERGRGGSDTEGWEGNVLIQSE